MQPTKRQFVRPILVGREIAYGTSMKGSRPKIYVIPADGKNTIRVAENQDGDALPNYSPDGNKLLITCFGGDNYAN